MIELIRTICKYLLAAICLVVALIKAIFNPPPTYKNMKNLLFAFMLLAALQSNAQTKKGTTSYAPNLFGPDTSFLLKPSGWTTEVAILKPNSDTLEVFYGKIKYIKIGTEVFEITSPSLKKVEPLTIGTYYKQFWPNNTQPAIH